MSEKTLGVNADSKFHSDAPFTCVDVVFTSADQVRSFINALEAMLARPHIETVELSDDRSSGDPGHEASIYFHKPGFQRDETDRRCLRSAEHLIMRYQASEQ